MSKLIVPKRLEKAAKDLKNNMTILKGCSPEVKEVIAIAAKQSVLRYIHGDGTKCFYSNISGTVANIAYCLPDNIEIVVEPQVPQWIKDKFSVCEVKEVGIHKFCIIYPNKSEVLTTELPAALRCDGWIFSGWLHDGCTSVSDVPFGWVDSQGNMQTELAAYDRYTESTAYASVWQKAESK